MIKPHIKIQEDNFKKSRFFFFSWNIKQSTK